jgi:DNA-directed RNA polymerase subunit RPC12/RpoP
MIAVIEHVSAICPICGEPNNFTLHSPWNKILQLLCGECNHRFLVKLDVGIELKVSRFAYDNTYDWETQQTWGMELVTAREEEK